MGPLGQEVVPSEAAGASAQACQSAGLTPRPGPPAPLAASPHLSTKARADGVWLLRQGKPSLCPAGLGRSHPDKEFDSSSPVVRQAGREGGNRQQAGRGPPGAWPCCGQAGQQGHPPAQRPLRPKGQRLPGRAGRLRRQSRGDQGAEAGGRGCFREQPRNRDPRALQTGKPQMLRHSGAQRWRRRDRDTERFRQTRYSETDVKPRKARGDGWANASCPVGLPVSWGSQNKNSGNPG